MTLDVIQVMQSAVAAYQKGQLTETDRWCRAILDVQADHYGALQLSGIVAAQTGCMQEAAELLDRAVSANPDNADACNYLGRVLYELGQYTEALEQFERALALRPDFAEACNNRGIALGQLGHQAVALASLDQALTLLPAYAEAWFNRGYVLLALKRYAEAEESYNRALALKPGHAEAWTHRGVALSHLGKHADALALKPDDAEAWNNRGTALANLERYPEAIESYEQALALKPDYAEAWNNRGIVLVHLERDTEALASHERAVTLKPDDAEAWNNLAFLMHRLQRHAEALDPLDRALMFQPDHAEAWTNRGLVMFALQRHGEAIESFERALSLRPGCLVAWSNRGEALIRLNRHAEALDSYEQAIRLKPDFTEAYIKHGHVLGNLGRYAEALASYDRALQLAPDFDFLFGSWLHDCMIVCEWTDWARHSIRLAEKIEAGKKATHPFIVLSVSDSPAIQRRAADVWVCDRYPADPGLPAIARYSGHEKIRVGYFSADFHEHRVSHLMAELFERHDRSRFHLTAFSFGPDTGDAMRQRVAAAFDAFIDVSGLSDREIVLLAREREIDIAVDLSGHTQGCRTGLFAQRAAPIQVHYLGYPGTLGAPFIDYILADRYVIPEALHEHYTEQVVYLPDTFQANAATRQLAEPIPSRVALGLPADGFVFCAFNASHKITPVVFTVWMRLLSETPGSVLWLLGGECEVNLRREATARGVGPERLVFAPRTGYAEYLARYTRADLFLDTLPFNGGTTASDALWAGLPVLTCSGEAFAARMAGSLLHAVGLPELVTHNLDDYEALALNLALNPARLAVLRERLAMSRHSHPLFDTERFRCHIEAAYTEMWERHQRGEPPASFAIEPIADPGKGAPRKALRPFFDFAPEHFLAKKYIG